jgi:hypothetical protein
MLSEKSRVEHTVGASVKKPPSMGIVSAWVGAAQRAT